jgi:hypothetical protein
MLGDLIGEEQGKDNRVTRAGLRWKWPQSGSEHAHGRQDSCRS